MPEISYLQFSRELEDYREANKSGAGNYKSRKLSFTSDSAISDKGTVSTILSDYTFLRVQDLGIESDDIDGQPIQLAGVTNGSANIILAMLQFPNGRRKYYSHEED